MSGLRGLLNQAIDARRAKEAADAMRRAGLADDVIADIQARSLDGSGFGDEDLDELNGILGQQGDPDLDELNGVLGQQGDPDLDELNGILGDQDPDLDELDRLARTVRFPEDNGPDAPRLKRLPNPEGVEGQMPYPSRYPDEAPYRDAIRKLLSYNNRNDSTLQVGPLGQLERPPGAKAVSSSHVFGEGLIPHNQLGFLFEAAISDNPMVKAEVLNVLGSLSPTQMDDLVANIYKNGSSPHAESGQNILSPEAEIVLQFIENGAVDPGAVRRAIIAGEVKPSVRELKAAIQQTPGSPIPVQPAVTTMGGSKGKFGRKPEGSNIRIEPGENRPDLNVPMKVGVDQQLRGDARLPADESIVFEVDSGVRIPAGLRKNMEEGKATFVDARHVENDNMSELGRFQRAIDKYMKSVTPNNKPGRINKIENPSEELITGPKKVATSGVPLVDDKPGKQRASMELIDQLWQMMQEKGAKTSSPVIVNADGTFIGRPGVETPEDFADLAIHLMRNNPTAGHSTEVIRSALADGARQRWYTDYPVQPATDAEAVGNAKPTDWMPSEVEFRRGKAAPNSMTRAEAKAHLDGGPKPDPANKTVDLRIPDTSALLSESPIDARAAAENLINSSSLAIGSLQQGLIRPGDATSLGVVQAWRSIASKIEELRALQRAGDDDAFIKAAQALKPEVDDAFAKYAQPYKVDYPGDLDGVPDQTGLPEEAAAAKQNRDNYYKEGRGIQPGLAPGQNIYISGESPEKLLARMVDPFPEIPNPYIETFKKLYPNVDLTTPQGQEFLMKQLGYYKKPNAEDLGELESIWQKSRFQMMDEGDEAADAAGAAAGPTTPGTPIAPDEVADVDRELGELLGKPAAQQPAQAAPAPAPEAQSAPAPASAADPAPAPVEATKKSIDEVNAELSSEGGDGNLPAVPDQAVLDEAAKPTSPPTNDQLKAQLKERGVKVPKNANKATLQKLLDESNSKTTATETATTDATKTDAAATDATKTDGATTEKATTDSPAEDADTRELDTLLKNPAPEAAEPGLWKQGVDWTKEQAAWAKQHPVKAAGGLGVAGVSIMALINTLRGAGVKEETPRVSTVPPPGGYGAKGAGTTTPAPAKVDPLEAFIQSMRTGGGEPPAPEYMPLQPGRGGMPGYMPSGPVPGVMPTMPPIDIIREEQKRRRPSPQTLQRYT